MSKCEIRLPWIGDRGHDCQKPAGHHGVHRCGCGEEWLNADDFTPCTEMVEAVLGVVYPQEGVALRCGLQADHSGNHRFAIEWSGHD